MSFSPASLQQRFTILLIVPVTLLLVVMGVAGFLYARDMLLAQWREAAILKLQRAAHQMDMHLLSIKEGVRLFQDTSGGQHDESFHAWALDRLIQQEGILDVKLSWNRAEDGSAARLEAGPPAQSRDEAPAPWVKRGGCVDFTAPASVKSPLRASTHPGSMAPSARYRNSSMSVGRPSAGSRWLPNFDFLFRHVVESGWWQSNKAYLVDESGRILVCTVPGRHGKIYDTDDLLEKATFKAMSGETSGTVRGEGRPPTEISGFYRLGKHRGSW